MYLNVLDIRILNTESMKLRAAVPEVNIFIANWEYWILWVIVCIVWIMYRSKKYDFFVKKHLALPSMLSIFDKIVHLWDHWTHSEFLCITKAETVFLQRKKVFQKMSFKYENIFLKTV